VFPFLAPKGARLISLSTVCNRIKLHICSNAERHGLSGDGKVGLILCGCFYNIHISDCKIRDKKFVLKIKFFLFNDLIFAS
jgi:hypothetical protein